MPPPLSLEFSFGEMAISWFPRMAVSREAGLENSLPPTPRYPGVMLAEFYRGFLVVRHQETAMQRGSDFVVRCRICAIPGQLRDLSPKNRCFS